MSRSLAQALLKYYGTPEMKQRANMPGEMVKFEEAFKIVLKEQTVMIGPSPKPKKVPRG